jgi:Bacterial regulatory proteins, tetR family
VSETGGRPVRADARRNHDRLLDAAVRAFASDGAEVTLDAIAKTAGVGIGTLYRHFPTREALVEAVGFQKSVICSEQQLYAARSYSLIKPPSIGRRLIRCRLMSATG